MGSSRPFPSPKRRQMRNGLKTHRGLVQVGTVLQSEVVTSSNLDWAGRERKECVSYPSPPPPKQTYNFVILPKIQVGIYKILQIIKSISSLYQTQSKGRNPHTQFNTKCLMASVRIYPQTQAIPCIISIALIYTACFSVKLFSQAITHFHLFLPRAHHLQTFSFISFLTLHKSFIIYPTTRFNSHKL